MKNMQGQVLQNFRNEHNLSLGELAEKLSETYPISRMSLWGYENGKYSPDPLRLEFYANNASDENIRQLALDLISAGESPDLVADAQQAAPAPTD